MVICARILGAIEFSVEFTLHTYVTMPGKTDHFQSSRYWYHVVVRYSLYAMVK